MMPKALEYLCAIFLLTLPLTVPLLIWAILIGALAARKSRNGWLWGAGCGLSVPLSYLLLCALPSSAGSWAVLIVFAVCLAGNLAALLILAGSAYRCPRCRGKLTRRQRKERVCPKCGGVGDEISAAISSLSRRARRWIFLLVLLFVMALFLLPYTGLLDIHQ